MGFQILLLVAAAVIGAKFFGNSSGESKRIKELEAALKNLEQRTAHIWEMLNEVITSLLNKTELKGLSASKEPTAPQEPIPTPAFIPPPLSPDRSSIKEEKPVSTPSWSAPKS